MPSQFVLDSGLLNTDLLGSVVIVTASADLGSLGSSSTSLVTHNATATGALGNLTATARAAETIQATANAPLGSLSATANTQPVTPTVATSTIGSPSYVQPNFVQPTPPQEVQVSTIIAGASASLGLLGSQAMAEITFSILEDDAEVLLLI